MSGGVSFTEADLRKLNLKKTGDNTYAVNSKKDKPKPRRKLDVNLDGIYTFKVDPVAKPRMTQSDAWNKRPAVVRYHRFKDALNAEVMSLNVPDLPGKLKSLVFLVPMPKSWSVKKRNAMYGKPHEQRPDLDNYLKAFWDALCKEDGHIYCIEGQLAKYWDHEGKIILKI